LLNYSGASENVMMSSFGIIFPAKVNDEIWFILKIPNSIMRFTIRSHGNEGMITNAIYGRMAAPNGSKDA
jgi:hypothetical protein